MATDYIRNAKEIHKQLIRGDFAIKREVVYIAQISSQEAENKRLTKKLEACENTSKQQATDLATTRLQVKEQTLLTRQAKLQIWAMRVAILLYAAGKIKGLLP